MKKLTFVILLIVIGLTGFASAQQALPDLKVNMKPISFKSTKYPPYTANYDNGQYRLAPGDIVEISVEVSNNGQSPSGPFTLEVHLFEYYTAKSKVFTKKFADMKPGEKSVFNQDFKIETTGGDVRCKAFIATMAKEDWNKGDNSIDCGTIIYWNKQYVDMYLRPDLEIKLSSPDDIRHLARTVRIKAVVTNKGNAASPATEIVLKCKEKDTKKHSVPSLKPGSSFEHEFQHKWHTLGTKQCTARVNHLDKFDELDTQNNVDHLSVYIK